jgi:hypothetical protein
MGKICVHSFDIPRKSYGCIAKCGCDRYLKWVKCILAISLLDPVASPLEG